MTKEPSSSKVSLLALVSEVLEQAAQLATAQPTSAHQEHVTKSFNNSKTLRTIFSSEGLSSNKSSLKKRTLTTT
jgi:Leu/Phe-tRNA-protein transferase